MTRSISINLPKRQVDYVRGMIARGASAAAIRAGLDEIAAWSRRAAPMRERAANIDALENMARSNPGKVGVRVAIARYWVRQLQLARDEIPSDRPRMYRVWVKTRGW